MNPIRTAALALSLLLVVPTIVGAQVPGSLSTHGLPGLVNTPNATSIPSGEFSLNFNTMPDYQLLGEPIHDEFFAWQTNFQFAFGLWDRLVVGVRGTEQRAESRLPEPNGTFIVFDRNEDPVILPVNWFGRLLSGNVHLLLARETPTRPSIAVGYQDIAGSVVDLQGRFAVASKTLWDRARLSLGYGIGRDVLDGIFGGVEWAVVPNHLTLVGEYDTERFNAGLKLQPYPRRWTEAGYGRASLDLLWAEDEGVSFGVGLQMPFDPGTSAPRPPRSAAPAGRAPTRSIDAVTEGLIRLGLENVRVAASGDRVTLEFENRVFNQSDLDAIAEAAWTAHLFAPESIERIDLTLKHLDLPVATVNLSRSEIERLRFGGSSTAPTASWAGTRDDDQIRPESPLHNSSRGRIDLTVRPKWEAFYFSELGVVKGRISVVPEASVRIAPGTTVDAAVDVPIDQDARFAVTSGELPPVELGRTVLSHLRRIGRPGSGPLWLQWSVGRQTRDDWGLRQQAEWIRAGGRFSLASDVALLGPALDDVDRLYLKGEARVSFPEHRTRLSVGGGRFLSEDWGVQASLTRFWGDVRVDLSYWHTELASQVGMGLTVPLSFRRDLRPAPIRPRLPSDWFNQARTVVFESDRNPLRFDVGRSLPRHHLLDSSVFDQGRLDPAWIRARVGDSRHWSR